MPENLDLELTAHDLQDLSGADAVAGFFARLGYNTDVRGVQTAGNLGITAEGTTRQIQRIELLADQESLLRVYLFEVTSVTVAITRALARAFRNLQGNYLFVVTSDYERLDFVLVDKAVPKQSGNGRNIGQAQISVRPRTLTVDRKKPEPVQLRVLRRFAYTESDPLGQFEKLKSAYTIADWSEELFNNRALFSDHFLVTRLREEFPEWREDPKPAYRVFQELYRGARGKYANLERKDLATELYEPLFRELGFTTKAGRKASEVSARSPDSHLQDPESGQTLALCLAYPWGRSLDSKDDQRDAVRPDENPGAHVVSLLQDGEVGWAVVTNGKIWRLYSAATHSRATNYYEIDLEEALAAEHQSPGDAFRYFWLLFRHEAFRPELVQREGRSTFLCFLDHLLVESQDYAKKLGERLKDRIFVKVFPRLAEGCITSIRAQEGAEADLSQPRLDEIYRGTLTLLYRLLFLFYAESRDLLPVKETRGYFEVSLSKLKHEIKEAVGDIEDEVPDRIDRRYRADSYQLWDRLTRLSVVIGQGNSDMNVPFYNGGLFMTDPDPEDSTAEAANARFLKAHRVPDRHLASAIDLLARDPDRKRQDLVFLDYKSLGVRHLGSIYEGLLEFKLRIASRKLGAVKQKNREVYRPFSELNDRQKSRAERGGKVVSQRKPYLENDKHERKATGSYYTSDHIVEYIVKHTVGPVLDERFEKLRVKLRESQTDRRAFQKRQAELKRRGLKPEPESKADLIGRTLVDDLFDVKVLDPAMGSGHFLVETVDYITDRILELLSAFPWNPVLVHLEEMRQIILREMNEQEVTIDPGRLTDVNLLKRHVLKRCVYGVDLNPMAVELAKVSLWLDCFTLGAPLSFLDHHLRTGNSLIGTTVAQVDELRTAKGQLPLSGSTDWQGLRHAIKGMIEIGGLPDATAAQLVRSRKAYQSALLDLQAFKTILNVSLARWFLPSSREPRSKKSLRELMDEVIRSGELFDWANGKRSAVLSADPYVTELAKVPQIAAGRGFFHWELEFPEVFYGLNSNTTPRHAGFDVVIGNPPYVNAIELNRILSEYEKPFWRDRLDAARGAYDLYVLFLEQALRLLNYQGRAGLITPNKYLAAPYAEALRRLLYEKAQLIRLLDVSGDRVFEDPSVYPVVLIYRHLPKERPASIQIDRFINDPSGTSTHEHEYCRLALLPSYIWGFLLSDGELLDRVLRCSVPLGEICTVNASTSTAEADEFTDRIVEDAELRREGWLLVNTGTIDPYRFRWGEERLTHQGRRYSHPVLLDDPNVVSENRRNQYNAPKIIFAKMASRIEAAFDDTGRFASVNTNFAFCEGEAGYFYLGLFNSRLMTCIYEQYFGALRMSGGYLQFQAPQLRALPVIPFDPADSRMRDIAALAREASKRADPYTTTEEIDKLVCNVFGIELDSLAHLESVELLT